MLWGQHGKSLGFAFLEVALGVSAQHKAIGECLWMTLGQRFSRDGGPPAGPVRPHASKLHGAFLTCLDIIKTLTLCP